jgi:glycosyltransferase involved in cell wall biosynthesis
VVATATGGAREIVEDGVTGKLVPIRDATSLAEAVITLLEDDGERHRMGERASVRARRHFSLERMVAETEALYREVLGVK